MRQVPLEVALYRTVTLVPAASVRVVGQLKLMCSAVATSYAIVNGAPGEAVPYVTVAAAAAAATTLRRTAPPRNLKSAIAAARRQVI